MRGRFRILAWLNRAYLRLSYTTESWESVRPPITRPFKMRASTGRYSFPCTICRASGRDGRHFPAPFRHSRASTFRASICFRQKNFEGFGSFPDHLLPHLVIGALFRPEEAPCPWIPARVLFDPVSPRPYLESVHSETLIRRNSQGRQSSRSWEFEALHPPLKPGASQHHHAGRLHRSSMADTPLMRPDPHPSIHLAPAIGP